MGRLYQCQLSGYDTVLLFCKILILGKTEQDIWGMFVLFIISELIIIISIKIPIKKV